MLRGMVWTLRGWSIAIAIVLAACGGDDDDGGASTGGASLEDGPEPTTMPNVDDGGSTLPQGSSDGADGSGSDGASTAAMEDSGSGSGSESGSGSDSGSGSSGDTTGVGTDDGGVAVDSCDKCPAPQLCVELTEHA